MSKDGSDESAESLHVHPGPPGQAIDPIDQPQPGAKGASRDYDGFHFSEAKRDLVEIDRDLVGFLDVHDVAGKVGLPTAIYRSLDPSIRTSSGMK